MATQTDPRQPWTEHLWALVLAGGDGTRLRELVVDTYGYPRPKQFCALVGPHTLLEETIARAGIAVPRDRIVVSTTAKWRRETCQCLARTPGVNLLEQPSNAGTTAGLLVSLLEIYVRDPRARVAILPSDHYISDDRAFMRTVVQAAKPSAPPIVLLGAHLRVPEDGLGWIVPEGDATLFQPVERFVEKPGEDVALELLSDGALANTFAMVAQVRVLLELIGQHVPLWFHAATGALGDPAQMRRIYSHLPPSDLSSEVLQQAVGELHTVSLDRSVIWSDIGTPERLERVLRSLERRRGARPAERHAAGL